MQKVVSQLFLIQSCLAAFRNVAYFFTLTLLFSNFLAISSKLDLKNWIASFKGNQRIQKWNLSKVSLRSSTIVAIFLGWEILWRVNSGMRILKISGVVLVLLINAVMIIRKQDFIVIMESLPVTTHLDKELFLNRSDCTFWRARWQIF